MEENNIIQEKVNKVNGDILIKEYVKGKLLGKGNFFTLTLVQKG